MDLAGYNLSVIAPKGAPTPSTMAGAQLNGPEYRLRISEIQKFRGAVLVSDGAIRPCALDPEGRHYSAADFTSWHVLSSDGDGKVHGCIRLSISAPRLDLTQLAIGGFISRIDINLQDSFLSAIRAHVEMVIAANAMFGEVGGWAVDDVLRQSSGSVALALACWSLYQILGRTLPIATATTWHNSSKMLKRLGGFVLQRDGTELSPVFDPFFQCEMELLAFDSAAPRERYVPAVQEIKRQLLEFGARVH